MPLTRRRKAHHTSRSRHRRRILCIGVTGGVGTGKSTVAGMFRELGAVVLDADRIAHALMRPGTAVYRKIQARFGRNIAADGRIDRRRLADRAFENRAALEALCQIVHPAVRRRIGEDLSRLGRSDPDAVVVLDIPLLLESGRAYPVDVLVVVSAPFSAVARRLKQRSGWPAAEIRRRMSFQMPLREKERQADFVVRNGGSETDTRRQVVGIWWQLTTRGRFIHGGRKND